MATVKLFLGFEAPNVGGENVAAGALDSPVSISAPLGRKLDRCVSLTNGASVDLRTAAELASFTFGYIVSDQIGTIVLAAAGTSIPLVPNVPLILGGSTGGIGTITLTNGTTTANVRGVFLA